MAGYLWGDPANNGGRDGMARAADRQLKEVKAGILEILALNIAGSYRAFIERHMNKFEDRGSWCPEELYLWVKNADAEANPTDFEKIFNVLRGIRMYIFDSPIRAYEAQEGIGTGNVDTLNRTFREVWAKYVTLVKILHDFAKWFKQQYPEGSRARKIEHEEEACLEYMTAEKEWRLF